jgi:D-aspartate ligase
MGVSVTGLSYLRSLHRHGVPTLLLTERGWVGSPSRYGLTAYLPRLEDEPEVWLEVLTSTAGMSVRHPVLLVGFDQALLLVGEHAEELAGLYDFLVPPLSTSAAIVDKRRQYGLAAAAGIPIPRTFFPESSAEAVASAAEIEYPVLLKPYVGSAAAARLGGKAKVVDDPSMLRALFDRLADDGVPCMVQEIVPGGDDALYGYLSFWGSDATELAWITKQKLRQEPTLYGDGSYQRTVEAPRVAELSRRFLKALDYRGVGSVEFKYDARDDSFRLMEVNARGVSANQLAVAAGVDLPYISYAYHADAGVPAWEQRWDVHWIHEVRDMKVLLRESESSGTAAREWIRSLRRADAFAFGAWDDPAPLLGAVAQVVGRKSVRRLESGSPRVVRGVERTVRKLRHIRAAEAGPSREMNG